MLHENRGAVCLAIALFSVACLAADMPIGRRRVACIPASSEGVTVSPKERVSVRLARVKTLPKACSIDGLLGALSDDQQEKAYLAALQTLELPAGDHEIAIPHAGIYLLSGDISRLVVRSDLAALASCGSEQLVVVCLSISDGSPVEGAHVRAMLRSDKDEIVVREGLTNADGTVRLASDGAEAAMIHVMKNGDESLAVVSRGSPDIPVKLPYAFASAASCLPGQTLTFAARITPGHEEVTLTHTEPAGKTTGRKLSVSPGGWLSGEIEFPPDAPAGPHSLSITNLHLGTLNVAARPGVLIRPEKRIFQPNEPVRCFVRGVDKDGSFTALNGTLLFRRARKDVVRSIGPVKQSADKPLELSFTTNTPNRYRVGFASPGKPAHWTAVTVASDGAGLPGNEQPAIRTDRDIYSCGQRVTALFHPPDCSAAVVSVFAGDLLAERLLRFDEPTQCVEVGLPAEFEGLLVLRLTWMSEGKPVRLEKRLPVVLPSKVPPAVLADLDISVDAISPNPVQEAQPTLEDVLFPTERTERD